MLEKIKTPEELLKFIKENIKYGFISSNDNKIYIRKEMNKKIQDIKLFKYNKGIFNENFFKYVCDNCKIKKDDILL